MNTESENNSSQENETADTSIELASELPGQNAGTDELTVEQLQAKLAGKF